MTPKVPKKVLFVCSQNKLRSPTAEAIFSDTPGFEVQSAGLNNDATLPLTPELVIWADYIFVMEAAQRKRLRHKFRRHLDQQRIICLEIPDDYDYMDPGLINLLKYKLGPFFDNP